MSTKKDREALHTIEEIIETEDKQLKVDFIPHSKIKSIDPDIEKIWIETDEGDYYTRKGFKSDSNGISGEFQKDHPDS